MPYLGFRESALTKRVWCPNMYNIYTIITQIDEMKLELACFQRLREIEDRAVGKRLSKMQAEVS